MSSRELSAGIAEWLVANKPASYVWEIRPEQADAAKVRPLAVVVVEPNGRHHPALPKFTVTLRGEYLPKALKEDGDLEQEAFPDAFAELCALMTDAEKRQSLREELAARGMLLKVLSPGDEDEFPHEEKARRIEAEFAVTVQIQIPAGSAGL